MEPRLARVFARRADVGYINRMVVSRRWLIGVTCWVACGGAATAPGPVPQPAMSRRATAPAIEAPAPGTPEPAAEAPCPEDPARDGHQKPDHVVQLMQLSDGMTVVDLGSGNGYFLCRLSRAVGPRGRVIATEIDEKLVRDLDRRVAREQLTNVDVVQAPTDDVGIAPGSADRILLVKVWHHIANRRRYAARVARALKPAGKVVVVDFKKRSRRSDHGISPDDVIAELAAGGISATLVAEELSDQYVVIGTRD
jgi:predicted methyltransferase